VPGGGAVAVRAGDAGHRGARTGGTVGRDRLSSVKAAIFALAAGFAGLAGGLYAHLARFVTPDDFGLIFSIQALTMAIVGGLSSVFGGIIDAAVVTVAGEWLRAFPAEQPILYGAALMLLVRYMPDGAAGAAARAGERLLSLRRGAKPKPTATA
jgi:branched-chain amino acid transport system permease protein